MRSWIRIAVVACALIMVALAFQSAGVRANQPNTGASEFNHARENGASASASGSTSSYISANAIDGSTLTYWQSSTTTGWLAVRFGSSANVDEVHIHFRTTKYASLSVYLDTNGDGTFETKVWSTTKNGALDVVAGFTATSTSGVKVTIDAKSGSAKPMINELEAYLRYDTDGDGLVNSFETGTIFYSTASMAGAPTSVPDMGYGTASVQTNVLAGVPSRGLADVTLSHPKKEDLSASLAYWDGTAWIEIPVWDPGGHLVYPSIVSPVNSGVVGDLWLVVVMVADSELVTRVDFYVDSEGSPRGSDSTPEGNQYSWDWSTTGLSDGAHILRARSVDVWGATHESSVSVTVDHTGPSVLISSPLNNAIVRGVAYVNASASDSHSGISLLSLYVDGALKWSGSSPAYAYLWNTAGYSEAAHTLTATASDVFGHVGSASITVTVDNFPLTASISGADHVCDGDVVTLTGTASGIPGLSRVVFAGTTYLPNGATSWGPVAKNVGPLPVGTYSYTITATDTTGASVTGSHGVIVHVIPSRPYCWFTQGPVASGEATAISTEIPASTSVTWGTGASSAVAGYTYTNGNHRIVVDFIRSRSALSDAERSGRVLPLGLAAPLLNIHQMWRLTVRDWAWSSQGSVISVSFRVEETTSATSADTDGDGIGDGTEFNVQHTSPIARDTDADGLSDDYEIVSHSLTLTVDGIQKPPATIATSATNWDSDGDGVSDGEEISLGTDGVVTDPTSQDTDRDGLSDGPTIGAYLGEMSYFSDATWKDTDNDGLSDYDEVVRWGTSPRLPDTDDDGLNDCAEVTLTKTIRFTFPRTSFYGPVDAQGFLSRDNYAHNHPGWYISTRSGDDGFWTTVGDTYATLYSPRLDLRDALEPGITFHYSLTGTGYAEVCVVMPDSQPCPLWLSPNSGWPSVYLDLAPYQSSMEGFSFVGYSTDPSFHFSVDDIILEAKTNPLVEDTDHDGLSDGAEVNVWGLNPIASDSDLDGIPDFQDSSPADDLSPRILQWSSADFRQYVDVMAFDPAGIASWSWWGQHLNGEMTPVGQGAADWGGGQYRIVFNWDHFETIYVVVIDVFDVYGRSSKIQYTLGVSDSNPGTTITGAAAIGLGTSYAPAGAVAVGDSGYAFSFAALAHAALRVTPIAFVFVVVMGCTWPTTSAVTDPGTPDVHLPPDAYPLMTWNTFIGTVSLYPGYSAAANGLLRGSGWSFISALYPGVTFDTIANVMSHGLWTQFEDLWIVAWTTTVDGIATLYRLSIRYGTILSLEMSEIVIDKLGNEISIGEQQIREHFISRHGENPGLYPTLEDYRNRVRENLQDPDEMWYSTGKNDPYGRKGYLYIKSMPDDPAHKFIVITDENFVFKTAWVIKAIDAYAMAYSKTPGARFEVPIFPLPPYR